MDSVMVVKETEKRGGPGRTQGNKEPHLSRVVACIDWAATAWLLCTSQLTASRFG